MSDSSGSVGAGVSGRKRSTGERKKGRDKDGFELVKDEELEVICDLGAGNGGTVTKCWNKKRLCVMARKVSSGVLCSARAVVLRYRGIEAQSGEPQGNLSMGIRKGQSSGDEE